MIVRVNRRLGIGVGLAAITAAVVVVILGIAGVFAVNLPPTGYFGPFAGYVWTGPVTSAQASWTVPTILDGSSVGEAGTWVGAQQPGAVDNRVVPFIQIGTDEERVSVPASPARRDVYYAFWSDAVHGFHPQFLMAVSAGDTITASLVLARGQWALRLRDTTSGRSVNLSTRDEGGAALFGQAEWFQEDVTSGRTNRPEPYPTLSAPSFHGVTVDSETPSYAMVSSQWMSLPGGSLAPTPLQGGAFSLVPATLEAPAARYVVLSNADGAAHVQFVDQFSAWTLATPHPQIVAQSAQQAALLATFIAGLSHATWPPSAQPYVGTLVRELTNLMDHTRAAASVPAASLPEWRLVWIGESAAVAATGRLLRRDLYAPEIIPLASG